MARSKSHSLLRALGQLLPDAELSVVTERAWHSLTFTGVQTCLRLTIRCDDHAMRASALTQDLPQHQFDLRGQLVADIAVIQNGASNTQSCLLVDALVLDD